MTDIDFLPAEYWKRRASQRDQWYLLAIGAASLVLLLGSVVHQSSNTAKLQAQLNSLDTEYKDVLLQVEEVKRLEERRAPLVFDAKLYSLLRAHPSLSRSLAAIATSCPPHLTLNSIRVKPTHLSRPEPMGPGTPVKVPAAATGSTAANAQSEQLGRLAAERERTQWSFELAGVAESDLDVVEFIERLERAGCFAEVTPSSLESQVGGGSELREFRIQCRLAEVL